MEESPNPPQEAEPADTTTDGTKARYTYTNDILAGLLVGTMLVITAAYVYRGQEVPMWLATVDVLAMLSAVIWAFGRGVVKEARKAVSGDNS